MTMYRHQDKDFMERAERLDITDYVQTFMLNFKQKKGVLLKINYFDGADYLKQLLNSPENKICSPLESINEFFYWSPQKVDFIPSNLGKNKGYVFYFICIYCETRVKYLYKYRTYESPMCRTCCKLGYVPPSRRARNISRLIRKPYLSSEAKYLIVKYAGITKKDVPE